VICVADSKIYHKVGSSNVTQNIERKVVLFAVNRLVDLRQYYLPIIWNFWAIISLVYFWGLLFFKYHCGWQKSIRSINAVKYWVNRVWEVNKDTFDAIMNGSDL